MEVQGCVCIHPCVCVCVAYAEHFYLNRNWKSSPDQQITFTLECFCVSLCFTAGTLYVRADNLYVSTLPLMHCVYSGKVADGCLVNDTEDRLPPSFCCSEDLSLRRLQDACQLTGTEVLQCCQSYANPPVSWDYTCYTSACAICVKV